MKSLLIIFAITITACGAQDTPDHLNMEGTGGKGDIISEETEKTEKISFSEELPDLEDADQTQNISFAKAIGDILLLNVKDSSCEKDAFRLHIAPSEDNNYKGALECTKIADGDDKLQTLEFSLTRLGDIVEAGATIKLDMGSFSVEYRAPGTPILPGILILDHQLPTLDSMSDYSTKIVSASFKGDNLIVDLKGSMCVDNAYILHLAVGEETKEGPVFNTVLECAQILRIRGKEARLSFSKKAISNLIFEGRNTKINLGEFSVIY